MKLVSMLRYSNVCRAPEPEWYCSDYFSAVSSSYLVRSGVSTLLEAFIEGKGREYGYE